VAIPYADGNLAALPESLDSVAAASLGCRFATAFRALEAQARVRAGDWVAVHGCGGVGLSAIMIARAMGARIIAADIAADKLDKARELEIYGSHGIQAHRYGLLPGLVASGRLHPELLVTDRYTLAEGMDFLQRMDQFPDTGIRVVDRF
jgi:NADPH:quinone reductase-like Zn-dependent oxidoreductase